MKRVLWGLVIVVIVVGAGLFGLGWMSHGVVGKIPAGSPVLAGAPVTHVAPGNPAPNITREFSHTLLVSPGEIQRLRADRETVLQANPDLAAEYQQIISGLQAMQSQMDTDAIKADPKVAAIIAKLNALHQHNGIHPPSPVPGPGYHP
jgi:hypothetical protein